MNVLTQKRKIIIIIIIIGIRGTLLDTWDPFSSRPEMNLVKMDQRTRKLMSLHNALHPRDDVNSLYVSRKEGGRGLASIEDSVNTSIQRLKDYLEKHEGGLITAIRNNTDNTIDN